MREGFRVKGLRRDKDLSGLIPKHHVCKPSTEMNKYEVAKYLDQMACEFDKAKFVVGVKAAIIYDLRRGSFESPFVPPNYTNVRMTIDTLKLAKSAGPTAEGLSAKDYLLALGKGDEERGKAVCAERVLRIYRAACDPKASSQSDQELLTEVGYWHVIGKDDKYKLKKTPIATPPGHGRTIQAPSFELKVLWRTCFGENDTLWSHREDSWVRSGENEDLPTSYASVDALARALGAIATDLTAYDRYMMACMIYAFFMIYLHRVCPGAPELFLRWLAHITIRGPLLFSDGEVWQRDHGNPSGFMNTLRLNCVVHLFVFAYIMAIRMQSDDPSEVARVMEEEMWLSFCGDDSGHLALTERAMTLLDIRNGGKEYIAAWDKYTPWPETKLEAIAVFEPHMDLFDRVWHAPPMVGRRHVMVNGIVFTPLVNVSRTLIKLSTAENRTVEQERDLVNSAFATLALHLWWQANGWFYSPAIAYLWREYRHVGDPRIVTDLVTGFYRQEYRQHAPAEALTARLESGWAVS
jgi:hypothetical protein